MTDEQKHLHDLGYLTGAEFWNAPLARCERELVDRAAGLLYFLVQRGTSRERRGKAYRRMVEGWVLDWTTWAARVTHGDPDGNVRLVQRLKGGKK